MKSYCDKAYQNFRHKSIWSIKTSNKVLSKLQNKGYLASTLSTYDFSTLYTTLPHDLIKDNLIQLIKKTFQREKYLILRVVLNLHSLQMNKLSITLCGLAPKFVTLSHFFWITFSLWECHLSSSNWYSYGYKLCTTCRGLVFILL